MPRMLHKSITFGFMVQEGVLGTSQVSPLEVSDLDDPAGWRRLLHCAFCHRVFQLGGNQLGNQWAFSDICSWKCSTYLCDWCKLYGWTDSHFDLDQIVYSCFVQFINLEPRRFPKGCMHGWKELLFLKILPSSYGGLTCEQCLLSKDAMPHHAVCVQGGYIHSGTTWLQCPALLWSVWLVVPTESCASLKTIEKLYSWGFWVSLVYIVNASWSIIYECCWCENSILIEW